jgi:hypothetical protein
MASKKRDPITVAEWQRNGRERIRISLGQYYGRNVVSLRTWWKNEEGEERPGRDGITLDIRHVLKLARGFNGRKGARGKQG